MLPYSLRDAHLIQSGTGCVLPGLLGYLGAGLRYPAFLSSRLSPGISEWTGMRNALKQESLQGLLSGREEIYAIKRLISSVSEGEFISIVGPSVRKDGALNVLAV